MSGTSSSKYDVTSIFKKTDFHTQLLCQTDGLRESALDEPPLTVNSFETCMNIEQIQHHVNEPGVPDLQNEVLKLEICYDLSEEICKFHSHLANKGFLSSEPQQIKCCLPNRDAATKEMEVTRAHKQTGAQDHSIRSAKHSDGVNRENREFRCFQAFRQDGSMQ